MMLDVAAPNELADRIKGLAQRNDAVAALVADSEWLDLYLNSRGVERDLMTAIKTMVKAQVFSAAVTSGDAKRAAAGRAALALVHLRKASVAARSYRRNKLA
jgi:hypothetical protein